MMKVEDIIKIIKSMKTSQCNLIGGSLIAIGATGGASPFWFPLVDEIARSKLNLTSNTEEYVANNAMILFSMFLVILGVGLIILNRMLEHKENVLTKPSNIVDFPSHDEPCAFEAITGGSVVINGGKVKGYEKVAKASTGGVVSINEAMVVKNDE
ncbi:hypothetical protein [Moritella sp. 28]|uniref:hypothetical protein n=1 Tax=Moritella sp. 28 TaxID=2746232 RepID=UPI001BA4A52D|nr:hypothetical protein [Moritella sp. 28]QUM85306.1 hypothetical protein HWV02_12725 [Moritella sp. 28]